MQTVSVRIRNVVLLTLKYPCNHMKNKRPTELAHEPVAMQQPFAMIVILIILLLCRLTVNQSRSTEQ